MQSDAYKLDAPPLEQKISDCGIDSIKHFGDYAPEEKKLSKSSSAFKTCKIVASVKGGGNLKADDIRSLMAVREREGAEIALFISLEEPTRGMKSVAAAAGPVGVGKFAAGFVHALAGVGALSLETDNPESKAALLVVSG